jgi:hypothetical protein
MKKIITSVVLVAMALSSCKKKEVPAAVVPVVVAPSASQMQAFFATNIANATQTFSVNASNGGVVVGNKGTRLNIPGNCLINSSNQLVTGSVTVNLIEVFSKGDQALLNKSTMGIMANGTRNPLVSGGEYFLNISQAGIPLALSSGCYVRAKIPLTNTNVSPFGMQRFEGILGENGLEWDETGDTLNVIEDSVGGNFVPTYVILDNQWGWTNVDRFYSDPRPKTTLLAQLPSGYDNTNCEVYISYDGEAGLLASLDTYTAAGYFSEHYGQIPIGLNIHFIAVTMINGQLNYAIVPATVSSGLIQQITNFQPTTQSALAALINALP